LLVLHDIDEKAVSDSVLYPSEAPKSAVAVPPTPSPVVKAVAPAPAPSLSTPSKPTGGSTGLDLSLLPVGGGILAAFAVGTFLMRGKADKEKAGAASSPAPAAAPVEAAKPAAPKAAAPKPLKAATPDLSLAYDSAASLAYDTWRAKFDKGAFDASSYETFKANYEKITVANVTAKKVARETGAVSAKEIALDANGDQADGAEKVMSAMA